ncbi:LANO_0B00496g1_1 [Lachancea nothofagi CBS 11611]|uniref:5-formyltetrahydrofolate cyclo-ligase n=1 Tax=Lachancea nothofagi CBS 11611 TaxID=1266666 RepID=A0A1G4IUH0_9SACH|nr:LANO_0B00496g1_1 [Lachancea nothofagi CBS 11611]
MPTPKSILRSQIKAYIRQIPQSTLDHQSKLILNALKSVIDGQSSVACFMDMGRGEVRTLPIIKYLFDAHKHVYLPRCTNTQISGHQVLRPGVNSHPHLTFHEMQSLAHVEALEPQGKYQLREPPVQEPHPHPPNLDVVLVPGVAFSLTGGARMGHGAGFYDDYIHRTSHRHGKRPLLIGLALQEQIVPQVPTEAHDHHMDCIICGDGTVHWFSNTKNA